MAIAKMKKLTLISFHELKDQLLQSVQALQNFEVVDLQTINIDNYDFSVNDVDNLDHHIKKLGTTINQVQSALSFLESYLPKESLVNKLRASKEELSLEELEVEIRKFSPKDLTKQLLDMQLKLDQIAETRNELDEEEVFWSRWRNLEFSMGDLQKMQYIVGSIGTVPQHVQNKYINYLKSSADLYVNEIYQTSDEHGILIVYDKRDTNLKSMLASHHFVDLTERFSVNPKDRLKAIQEQITKLKKEKSDLQSKLKKMKDQEWQLKLTEEYLYAKLQREKSKKLIIDENHLFVMEGWLEEDNISSFRNNFQQLLPETDYALVVEDIAESDLDNVPIVLKNNDLIAPFEGITAMYSLPKYNEIDPTPFLAPFYLVFFGMMAADLGYGLLLWLATFIAIKAFNFEKDMRRNMKFFHLLSYPTMIWGLIYGSFFGAELPFVLLSTTNDVITILILSVVLGVIQVFFGLSINTFLKLKQSDKYGAVADGLGWIGIFVGIIILLLGNMILTNEIISTIGAIIAILSAVSILLASMLGAENKGVGLGVGFYNLYGITGYIGDIVSYTRLMALGVSSGSIALAFNMIIGFFPTWGRFTIGTILFVALHAVNLGLAFLGSYVHGARLIFVEFFGKFYEGGGKALNPLRTLEKYIQLKKQKEL
ncbi:V/A-type H+-transporting ATPase subunit I [Amphibacillus marinus]|uniref:V/A-type H+-transporting ATPase subunit I n=1 Tax=Amphibacillus marinus TaxID=872970 RepID=A0A1H8GSG8_9BACI|nr:V-type ATP synthase subunit I [Amphibacillus marinus]SEN46943.1 V/A-type H+-transporting ATPase subunit I [Amphibacillus marinus]